MVQAAVAMATPAAASDVAVAPTVHLPPTFLLEMFASTVSVGMSHQGGSEHTQLMIHTSRLSLNLVFDKIRRYGQTPMGNSPIAHANGARRN